MLSLKLKRLDARHVEFLTGLERVSSPWPWTRSAIESSLDSGHECRLIELDGSIAGYCIWMDNGVAIELLHIVVFRRYQRQGIARRVLVTVLAQAQEIERQSVWLEVRADNQPAIELYRSSGFTDQGRRTGYYSDKEVSMDAILMEKKVNQR